MKKTLGALFCGLVLLAGTGAALADSHGGFYDDRRGPSGHDRIVTVEEARRMREDRHVMMEGYIVEQIDDDEYIFSDNTGRIRVDIDDDDWYERIGPQDLVVLWGEIERDDGRVEIEVDRIRRR